jgi:flagellar hook-length control protein FliK
MIVQDTQPASLLLPPASLPDESEEAAPASAFAHLLNMFLPAPAAQIAPPQPPDSAPSAAFSMLPSTAPAPASDPAKFIGAEVIRPDEISLGIGSFVESTVTTPTLAGAEVSSVDENSRSMRDLPELPTSELSRFTIAESAPTTPIFAGPVIETSQDAAPVARSQTAGDTPSADAVDAAPVTMARGPRRDDEPPAKDLAETGWAETPRMTVTQPPIGVSSPARFKAAAKSEMSTDLRHSASPIRQPAGLDGSAMPPSPIVDMPPALASETVTAAASQPLGLLNQANNDLTTKQPVELPIAAEQAPARSDDRDSAKAPSLRTEDQTSTAAIDSSIANATAVQKRSDGMRHFPFTEGPPEIDPEPNPKSSGAVDAIPVKQDAEKSQAGMAPASPGVEHSAAKDGWQGQPRDGDAPANPSMVAGAAPTWFEESRRSEAAAPAWRPMVERLARDIGEHFRVGEQRAVLQLQPPDLGRVTIDLRIEDGQLHVRIAAEGQESQGLIENHLSELRQALRAGQIEVADLRVTLGDWQGSTGMGQNFNQAPHGRQEAPRVFAGFTGRDETVAEHPPQPRPSADGRVSMWA